MKRFLLGVLALCFPLMLATSLADEPTLFLAAAALSYIADAALYVVDRPAIKRLKGLGISVSMRFLVRQVLFTIFLVRDPDLTAKHYASWGLAVLVIHATRAAHQYVTARIASASRLPVETINIALDVRLRQQTLPRATGVRTLLHLDLLLIGALSVALLFDRRELIYPMTVLATAGALWIITRLTVLYRSLLREKPGTIALESAKRALEELQPEVVLYFSGTVNATYQVNMWLDIIDRLSRKTVVVVRERVHMPKLARTTAPVICVPRAADLEMLLMPSIRAALYPANVGKNIHMLRVNGVKHAFIGHGDSDKNASFNPFSRVYDKIFVAGQAGRDRYSAANIDIADERFEIVGRPQLSRVAVSREPITAVRTILYAPTWEGWFGDQNYTSLDVMGPRIIDILLERHPDVRILFRPHPLTGTTRTEVEAVGRAIAARLAATGRGHRTIWSNEGTSLYECFDMSDALITDISSVIADFVWTQKPYLVTNPAGIDAGAFVKQVPSASAAYLLDPDCGNLSSVIDSVERDDPQATARAELKRYLLGDPEVDPMAAFDAAVERLVVEAHATYPSRDRATVPAM